MKIRFVLFDMDGVIFRGANFWLELHHAYGTAEEGVRLADAYLSDDYATLAKIVGRKLWSGKPYPEYERLVREREYSLGARETVQGLKQMGLRTGIISSGPLDLALRAQSELGFDVVRANKIHARYGKLTGGVEVQVPDGDKLGPGLEMISAEGLTPDEVAMVGDGPSDAPLAAAVALGIAYNSRSEALLEVCRYHLAEGELDKVPALVAGTASATA